MGTALLISKHDYTAEALRSDSMVAVATDQELLDIVQSYQVQGATANLFEPSGESQHVQQLLQNLGDMVQVCSRMLRYFRHLSGLSIHIILHG